MNKALMEKRGFLRHFLIALAVFLASWQSALAQDYDEEYTYEAGTFWYIPEARSYSLNDENLAELVRQKDGKERILFKRHGDLIVTAFLYQQNFGEYSRTYLIHIRGEAVDETAVDKNTFALSVLELVNQERARAGCRPLKLAADLQDAAALRAREITVKFSHTRPNGKSCFTTVKNQGRGVGENIAAGSNSPAKVMEGWMNSPGHRKNILDPKFRELGVGYVYDGNTEYRHYWVQMFRR